MKKVYVFLTGLFFSISAFTQPESYDAKAIPAELLEGALAVVRTDEYVLQAEDGSASISRKLAITVLEEEGKEFGYFYRAYNKFIKYRNIKAAIYDANGKRVRKIKLDEIYDISNIASYSLYEDSRLKIIEPVNGTYPYTVEYTFDINLKTVLSYPSWDIFPGYDISVEYSSYKAIVPNGQTIRYFSFKQLPEPEVEDDKEKTVYFWEVKNLERIKREPMTPSYSEVFPELYLAPVNINYGGFEGKAESWNELGEWVWKMFADKIEFTPEARQEILDIVADCSNTEEKVKTLYKYMQDKVRYVNISIGIGGLEPIEAQRVHDVSYGDCKALTNYMRGMLDVADVKSVCALVDAGSGNTTIPEDFPSQQFNHVILMVPNGNDSIWLECTSQRLPAGYLGTFTDDRTVLLFDETGGKLGRTPAFTKENNVLSTKVEVDIDNFLDASIIRKRIFTGAFFNDMYSRYLGLDAIEQKRYIQNTLDLSGFTVKDYHYDVVEEIPVSITETASIQDDAFATLSGDYVVLPLTTLLSKSSVPERVRGREQELYLKREYCLCDTVVIKFPKELEVLQLPEEIQIESKFGTYASSVNINGNELIFLRKMMRNKGVFPADSYRDYFDFYRELNKADKQEVMFKVKSMEVAGK